MLASLKTVSLGELASFEMGQSPDSFFVNDAGYGVPFLQGSAEFGAITPQHSFYCTRPKKLCEINDVLISVRAPVGTLNKADRVYCIGRGLAAVRFNKGTLPKFGWHLLNYWASELRKVAQGSTFEAIGKAELENLRVAYLPENEQCKIANILDALDETIAHTSSLIAKLKYIKAGLLNDLLTRGLDENGELRDAIASPEQFKDSPLGRIPKIWNIKPIGEVFDMQLGKMLSRASKKGFSPFPYLANRNVQWDEVDISDLEWMDFNDSEQEKFSLLAGDLLVCEGGESGRTALWKGEMENCYFQKAIHRLRPKNSDVLPSYMLRFMHRAVKHGLLTSLTSQTSITHLTQEKFETLPLPLPAFEEQQAIVNIFDVHDTRIRTEQDYLEKLKLQKKGLMHDLLTGKVRVNQVKNNVAILTSA